MAKGRTNKEIPDIRNVWPNKIKNNVSNYNMRINGLFTSINGWEDQVNGLEYTGNCLKLSSGAYGVIDNLQPFKNLSLDDGLTKFKDNFNPTINELIGEFDIPVYPFMYRLTQKAYEILKSKHK